MENVKTKMAVLWLVFFCAMVLIPTFELYLPGFIEDIIAGESGGEPITAEAILLLAIITLIPPVMAVLSITLKDSINRWANIIVGIVFAFLALVGLGEYLMKQDAYYAGLILVAIVEFVVAALIVWFAWKWPKKED
jgi:O-antigen/teichoic acid export membrane protein